MTNSYGFRTLRIFELALYRSLLEPGSTRNYF